MGAWVKCGVGVYCVTEDDNVLQNAVFGFMGPRWNE